MIQHSMQQMSFRAIPRKLETQYKYADPAEKWAIDQIKDEPEAEKIMETLTPAMFMSALTKLKSTALDMFKEVGFKTPYQKLSQGDDPALVDAFLDKYDVKPGKNTQTKKLLITDIFNTYGGRNMNPSGIGKAEKDWNQQTNEEVGFYLKMPKQLKEKLLHTLEVFWAESLMMKEVSDRSALPDAEKLITPIEQQTLEKAYAKDADAIDVPNEEKIITTAFLNQLEHLVEEENHPIEH